tara:strand:+ start:186 stop:527 length:342 start_codon:yes stop_codon:yes gene_type:complete
MSSGLIAQENRVSKENIKTMISKQMESLNLNENQIKDFKDISQKFEKKLKAIRDSNKFRWQKLNDMKNLNNERDKEMKVLLNKEQYKQFKKNQNNNRFKMIREYEKQNNSLLY